MWKFNTIASANEPTLTQQTHTARKQHIHKLKNQHPEKKKTTNTTADATGIRTYRNVTLHKPFRGLRLSRHERKKQKRARRSYAESRPR